MGEDKIIRLVLQDCFMMAGTSFWYEGSVAGEVVFNTAMTGYPESLTDPLDRRQILMDENDIPVMGICLGNQILALASGAGTYKLTYGHRSHNQPVLECGTNRTFCRIKIDDLKIKSWGEYQ